jgi:predicted membrane channel-forming protein YqfA (hemolysin III family)
LTSAVGFRAGILVERLAVTDCEAIHDGLLRQPVNAITSLSLLVAGIWILAHAANQTPGDRWEQAAFGVAMVAVGVGSFLLHGPAPAWAGWSHDLSNLTAVLLVAVLNLGLMMRSSVPARLVVTAVGVGVLGIWLAANPTWTTPIAFVLAPAAVGAELATIRSRLRPRPTSDPRRTIAWLVAIVSISLAGAAFLLGREGSPLCNPESVVQFHGVWHVLVAVAAAAFATVAFEHSDSTV